MPSGKTHDYITLLLAAPTFIVAAEVTANSALALCVTGATLFGGWMFGPDLDTQSYQYKRWGVFRFLWFPYRVVIKHRSTWSHGLIISTPLRILYFGGVLALIISAAVYLRATITIGGAPPSTEEITQAWMRINEYLTTHIGTGAVWATLVGLWWGAALHTLTDVLSSAVRKSL